MMNLFSFNFLMFSRIDLSDSSLEAKQNKLHFFIEIGTFQSQIVWRFEHFTHIKKCN